MRIFTVFSFIISSSILYLANAQCPQASIGIIINTDTWGSETSWEIYDQANFSLVSSGGNYSGNTTYHENVCVDSTNCYTFIIYDDYNDGMCCNYGNGSFSVYYNGALVDTGGTFTNSASLHNIGGSCSPPSAPLQVDTAFYTPAQLLTNVLLGSGIIISNVSYTGAAEQISYFNNGNSIGIDSGILLTTGSVFNAPGPNSSSNATTFFPDTTGDIDLEVSIGSVPGSSGDACVLEFDMVASGTEVYLKYIFASEEYPEYVCSQYNDAFAFFVTGSGYLPNTNVALIPGTSTEVAINSINGGLPGAPIYDTANCASLGNIPLYIDNSFGHVTEYDGFTVPLTAHIGVVPNTTYHVKFVIADLSDRIYDSAIFLEAKSFTTPVQQNSVSLCPGDSVFAGGAWQSEAGSYTDTFTATNGSDSVVVTRVIAEDSVYSVSVSICQGDSFFFADTFVSAAGSYTDTFPSASACDSIVILDLSVVASIVNNLNIVICAGDSIFAGGAWQASPGVYADTAIASGGCDSITITSLGVDSATVWPGDANNDFIANNTDLLSIGLYFGETGFARDSLSYIWQAHCATNWSTSQSNGANKKHADCNGDGLIGATDTLALNINYMRIHAKGAPPRASGPPLALAPRKNVYLPGDTVLLDIVAGDNSSSVSELYGIAFSINFDNSMVEPGTVRLYFSDSWLGNTAGNLTLSKIFESSGRAEGAITRTNHQNASGYGAIGTLQFVASESVTSIETSALSIEANGAVKANSDTVTFTPQDTSFIIDGTNSIREISMLASLKIYPNPFTTSATIEFSLKQDATVELKIYDVVGRKVYEVPAEKYGYGVHRMKFENNGLGRGVFLVELNVDGVKTRRRLVQSE